MLTPITTLTLPGLVGSFPPPGVVPPVGPVVTLAFTLPLAGPPPNVIQSPVPQTCQNSVPNVALRVLVVDQDGAPVDLSTANQLQLWLLAPNQTKKPVAAALVSNGLDGLLEAMTDPDTLPQAGTWGLQAHLVFGANVLESRWGYFNVDANVVDF